jgi:hypothetical protein
MHVWKSMAGQARAPLRSANDDLRRIDPRPAPRTAFGLRA